MANDYFNAWDISYSTDDGQLYELYKKVQICIDSDNTDLNLINAIKDVLMYLKNQEKEELIKGDEYINKISDFIYMIYQCKNYDSQLILDFINEQNIIGELLQCNHKENINVSEIFYLIEDKLEDPLQKFVENYLKSNFSQTNNIFTYKDENGITHYDESLARNFFHTMFGYGDEKFLNDSEKTDILNRMLMYQDENGNICRADILLYHPLDEGKPSIIRKDDLESYLSKDYILPYPVNIEIQDSSDLSPEMIKKLEEHGMKIKKIVASKEIFTETSNEEPFHLELKYDLEKYMQDPSSFDKEINKSYDIISKLSKVTNVNELFPHGFKIGKNKLHEILIKDCSLLSVENLEEFEDLGIEIQNIVTLKDLDFFKAPTPGCLYNVETYKKCRRKIDEYISNAKIDDIPLNIPNREKIIFGRLCKLMSNITYDYSALSDKDKVISSRDLTGSLLEGTCVCIGYAELMKNIFACCGIECNILLSEKHAWNQIKLDDIWYNLDYTQLPTSIHNLLEQGPSNLDEYSKSSITGFLLQSDNSFYTNFAYTITHGKINKCSESIPFDELTTYLIGDLKEISKLPIRGTNPQTLFYEEILDNLTFNTRSSELSEAKEIFRQNIAQKQEMYSQKEGDR